MCFGPRYLLVPDKASKTFIANGGAERLEFCARALGDEFDPAVRQIANGAADFKTGGDGFDGITKADALHAA